MKSSNIYIDDYAKRIVYFKQNAICKRITEEVKKIDPINDFEEFKQYVSKHILTKTKNRSRPVLFSVRYGEEGQWYGHRRAFFEYCGMNPRNEWYLMPNILHGAEFVGFDVYREKLKNNTQYLITMSDFNVQQIHSIRPWLQVYPVGPYILYANDYYDKNWIESEKRKNKKTALYFPQHTTETAALKYNINEAKRNIDYLVDKYDTVLVSVYWADVDDPIFNYYKDRGAKLVSSGVRSDDNFIRRQKSLFELADDIYGNALGTNLGYALALGKTYYFFNDQVSIVDERLEDDYMKQNKECEKQIMAIWKEGNITKKREIYSKYWGKKYIKSREELQKIIKVQKQLLYLSGGDRSKMDKIIQGIVQDDKKYDFETNEIDIITKAVYESL